MRPGLWKIVLAVSLAFNIAVLAAAGVFYHQRGGYRGSPFGANAPGDRFLFEKLSLRSGQMKILRGNATAFHEQVDRKRQEITAKRMDLLRLLRADAPDAPAIHAALAEIGGIQEQLAAMVTAHILQQKEVLDREQQEKFLDLIQDAMMTRVAGNAPAGCN